MEKTTYTKNEVLELLERQRNECAKKAKVKRHEYVNPYSDSDGEMWHSIDEKSILNAIIDL